MSAKQPNVATLYGSTLKLTLTKYAPDYIAACVTQRTKYVVVVCVVAKLDESSIDIEVDATKPSTLWLDGASFRLSENDAERLGAEFELKINQRQKTVTA